MIKDYGRYLQIVRNYLHFESFNEMVVDNYTQSVYEFEKSIALA